ncbi:MAG: hypothetical protein HY207_00760 [Nitrospirae bacterium]|nr:hypothetical protein [Nitrospirota bacterium]
MNKTRLISLSLVSSIFVLSLVAGASTSWTQVVTVSLTNYEIKFDPPILRPGTVTIIGKNDADDLMHEIRIVKTALPMDKLPLEPDGSVDEDSAQLTTIASVEDLSPGKSRAATVELEPGRYVYFCNKHNHYSVGMRGEINVQP